MSSTNILKILLLIFIAFALGEILFTVQRYGFPKFDFFKPKAGSCKILEEKYCNLGKVFKHNKITYFAFGLPPDTLIFSRKNGRLDKTQEGKPFSGFRAVVRDDVGGTTLRGNVRFDDLFSKDVKAGDIIGYIGKDKIDTFGYQLLITITKRTSDGPVVDEVTLKELFKYQNEL